MCKIIHNQQIGIVMLVEEYVAVILTYDRYRSATAEKGVQSFFKSIVQVFR